MTYKVPAYVDVSHFHAPYKDSIDPTTQYDDDCSYRTAAHSVAAMAPIVRMGTNGRKYPVPAYAEISHFRAPYKDSMMGFSGTATTSFSTTGKTSKSASTGSQTSGDVKSLAKPKITPADVTYAANDLYASLIADAKEYKARVNLILDPASKWRRAYMAYLAVLVSKYEAESVRDVARTLLESMRTEAKNLGPGALSAKEDKALSAALVSGYKQVVALSTADLAGGLKSKVSRAGTNKRLVEAADALARKAADEARQAMEDEARAFEEAKAAAEREEKKALEEAEAEADRLDEEEAKRKRLSTAGLFSGKTPYYLVGIGAVGIAAYLYMQKKKESANV